MWNLLETYWYIPFIIGVIGLSFGFYWEYKKRQEVKAQFLVVGGCLGLIIVIFQIMSLISFIISMVPWVFGLFKKFVV